MKADPVDAASRAATQATGFEPADPAFADRVRRSFAQQRLLTTIGAPLVALAPGRVEIALPFREDLTQQHGFLHAGIITAVLDTACGYAALSLMPPEAAVLTVEYKVSLLVPARGDVLARARVLKPGRSLTVCAADAVLLFGEREVTVATMLATMMAVRGRPDVPAGL